MKGSKKQIEWATEIQANVVNTYMAAINYLKSNMPQDGQNTERIRASINAYREAAEIVMNAECAGDIIERFGDIHFTGDLMEDFAEIRWMIRAGQDVRASLKIR